MVDIIKVEKENVLWSEERKHTPKINPFQKLITQKVVFFWNLIVVCVYVCFNVSFEVVYPKAYTSRSWRHHCGTPNLLMSEQAIFMLNVNSFIFLLFSSHENQKIMSECTRERGKQVIFWRTLSINPILPPIFGKINPLKYLPHEIDGNCFILYLPRVSTPFHSTRGGCLLSQQNYKKSLLLKHWKYLSLSADNDT